MIVAVFILALWALFVWFVWDDLSDLIARQLEEIGAGESCDQEEALSVRHLGGLSATLAETPVVGADSPFDWDAA